MIDLSSLWVPDADQRRNDCVGQSQATYMKAVWKKFTGEDVEFSPAFIYLVTQGKVGTGGVNGTRAFQRLVDTGICLEKTYPYTDENLNRMPPPEAYAEAKKYRIKKFVETKSKDDVVKYLNAGLPVVAGFNMEFGPHAMTIFGYNEQGFIIVDSAGRGKFIMSYGEFDKRFLGATVVTKLPLTTVFAKKFNKIGKVFSSDYSQRHRYS